MSRRGARVRRATGTGHWDGCLKICLSQNCIVRKRRLDKVLKRMSEKVEAAEKKAEVTEKKAEREVFRGRDNVIDKRPCLKKQSTL